MVILLLPPKGWLSAGAAFTPAYVSTPFETISERLCRILTSRVLRHHLRRRPLTQIKNNKNNCGNFLKINKYFINLWCSRHRKAAAKRCCRASEQLHTYIGCPDPTECGKVAFSLCVRQSAATMWFISTGSPNIGQRAVHTPSEAAPENMLFLIIFRCKNLAVFIIPRR